MWKHAMLLVLRIVKFITWYAQATRKQNQNLAPSRVRHTPSIPYQDGRDGRWERQNIFFSNVSESSWWSNIFFSRKYGTWTASTGGLTAADYFVTTQRLQLRFLKNRKKIIKKKIRHGKNFLSVCAALLTFPPHAPWRHIARAGNRPLSCRERPRDTFGRRFVEKPRRCTNTCHCRSSRQTLQAGCVRSIEHWDCGVLFKK